MDPEPDVLETGLPDLNRVPLSALFTGILPGATDEQNAAFRTAVDTAIARIVDQLRTEPDEPGCC